MRGCATVLVLIVGCASSSTNDTKTKSLFQIHVGSSERVEMLHGTSLDYEVKETREASFTEVLTYRVEVLPGERGVSAEVKGQEKATVIVHVSETALPGDYTVRVIAQAENGASKAEINLRVPPKD